MRNKALFALLLGLSITLGIMAVYTMRYVDTYLELRHREAQFRHECALKPVGIFFSEETGSIILGPYELNEPFSLPKVTRMTLFNGTTLIYRTGDPNNPKMLLYSPARQIIMSFNFRSNSTLPFEIHYSNRIIQTARGSEAIMLRNGNTTTPIRVGNPQNITIEITFDIAMMGPVYVHSEQPACNGIAQYIEQDQEVNAKVTRYQSWIVNSLMLAAIALSIAIVGLAGYSIIKYVQKKEGALKLKQADLTSPSTRP